MTDKSRNDYARDWMRIKRAKARLPKLREEIRRLEAMIAAAERPEAGA